MALYAIPWTLAFWVIWAAVAEASGEQLPNCNEVVQEDRCACNERILLAIARTRPVYIDPTEGGNPLDRTSAIAIQQERHHRLHTFFAPDCEAAKSLPTRLPAAPEHSGARIELKDVQHRLRPARTRTLRLPGEGSEDPEDSVEARGLLPGQWEGWQSLFGGKATPMFFHVVSVEAQGRFVKACSDQGMVFGRVREGYLEFPRTDLSDFAYSVRLWASNAPRSRDLEGVVLLEVRPGEVVVAGLAWLWRAVRFDWSTPSSTYFCQDRDLEERRRMFREQPRP